MKTKIKTNKSAKKRFKITGTGKIKHRKGWKSHLLTGKSRTRKRKLKRTAILKTGDTRRVTRMLAYGT